MRNGLKCMVALLAFLQCAGASAGGLVLASAEQGKSVLTQRDEFVARLSPFDRAARLKSDGKVDEATYLAHVGDSVRAWDSAPARKRVVDAAARVERRLTSLGLPVPEVLIVRTSGAEEGGAAYTRGKAIVLPDPVLSDPKQDLAQVIAHETFHVISRGSPLLRDRLYGLIGFAPCPELVMPADLADRRITNPDAPRNDHQIKVVYQGRSTWAVPVLYAATKYDRTRGGEFFDYLEFRLALRDPVRFVGLGEVQGFFEQVGRNTNYVLHPEEILADNFSFLVVEKAGLASPELLTRILESLRAVGAGN